MLGLTFLTDLVEGVFYKEYEKQQWIIKSLHVNIPSEYVSCFILLITSTVYINQSLFIIMSCTCNLAASRSKA